MKRRDWLRSTGLVGLTGLAGCSNPLTDQQSSISTNQAQSTNTDSSGGTDAETGSVDDTETETDSADITVTYEGPEIMLMGNSETANLTVANNSSSQVTTVLNFTLSTIDEHEEITVGSNESRDISFDISVPDSTGTFDATITDSVGGTETTTSVEIAHPSEYYNVELERDDYHCEAYGDDVESLDWELVVTTDLENQPVDNLILNILFLDSGGRQIGSAEVSGETPTAGRTVLWDMGPNTIDWDNVDSGECSYVDGLSTDLDDGGSVQIRTSTDSAESTVTAEDIENNPSEYYSVELEREDYNCEAYGDDVESLDWELVVTTDLESRPMDNMTLDILFLDSGGRQIGSAEVSGETPTAGQTVLWDMGPNTIDWDNVDSGECSYASGLSTELDDGGSVQIRTSTDSAESTVTSEDVENNASEYYSVELEREDYNCEAYGDDVESLNWELVVTTDLESRPMEDMTLDILFLDSEGRQIGSAEVSGEPPTAGRTVLWDMGPNNIDWDNVDSGECSYVDGLSTDLDDSGSVQIE